jgi:hypothetical protein
MILKLNGQIARDAACRHIHEAPEGWVVRLTEPTRTADQNAALWPLLRCFAEQLDWPVNGKMVKMSDDDWKDTLSAAFFNETVRVAQGLDGGLVMLGKRTSKFTKAQFSEFLDYIQAVGTERGVRFD